MASTSRNSCWWRNCLTREKCLALASIFACMALLDLIETVKAFTINSTGSNVSTILNKIKNDVDPCSNFYEYACGKFIEETEVPENQWGVGTYFTFIDTLRDQIKATLTEERPKTEPKYFQLPNTLYMACMNKSSTEPSATQYVQKIVESLGGWPVIVGNSWNSNNSWSWQETIKKFRRLGLKYNLIMHFSIIEVNSKPYMQLKSASTGLDENDLISGINNTKVSAYYNKMVDIAVRFGAEKEAAKKALMESLQFQMDLAKIPLIRSNDLLTIKQLQQDYPQIDWLDYIRSLLPEDVVINESDQISVPTHSYLRSLFNLLEGTDKRVIANYFMGNLFADQLVAVNKQDSDCMESINSFGLSPLLRSLYIRKYVNKDFKTGALNIYNNLRAAFRQMLEKSQWMGDKTKHEAKRKLDAMTANIGVFENLLDNDKLEKFYGKLQINSNNYFAALSNVTVFKEDTKFSILKRSANQTELKALWEDLYDDTAKYSKELNEIEIAPVFQNYFFNAKLPNYINYGFFGAFIAHEMGHAFDDNCMKYDANGNLKDWWDPATKSAFLEKTKCIIEQYGNFTDKQTGLKLSGTITLNENIADIVGFKTAYLAYKQWVAENGEEPILPRLNYTARQMFWISAAQAHCIKHKKETIQPLLKFDNHSPSEEKLKKIITEDEHSPNEFRVLGSFSNMQDFSNDFNCPKRTPMNPTHKCEMW